jgi:hypothetical protein
MSGVLICIGKQGSARLVRANYTQWPTAQQANLPLAGTYRHRFFGAAIITSRQRPRRTEFIPFFSSKNFHLSNGINSVLQRMQEDDMRFWLLAGAASGLLLLGCDSSSRPQAARGDAQRRFESSQASDAAEDHAASRLPPGHPPTSLPAGHPPIGPAEGGDEGPLDASGGEVKLDALTLTAPEGWGRKQPQSTFIEAEFALPKAEGDDSDGRLTVSRAGGSIEANIERWKGQFTQLQDSQEEKIDVGGVEATWVDLSGEFSDQRGPFAPGVSRADYRMIAAIIPVGEQLHFIKATGPKKTMESHAEKIEEFVRSAKPNE